MFGLGDRIATSRHHHGALAVCCTLGLFAILAIAFGLGQGPKSPQLLLVAGTLWSAADVVTALLLLAQFYADGRPSYAILTIAYALSGLLTWPYLLTFPGVFVTTPLTLGDQSVFVYYWMAWHCTFPVLVVMSTLSWAPLQRPLSRRTMPLATTLTGASAVLVAVVIAATVYGNRQALPHLLVNGHLLPLDREVFHPAIFILNAVACVVLLARRGTRTTLQLWLCATMFSACLDSLLVNLSAKTFSYAWDVGKLIALSTATIVFLMILTEVVDMYRRERRLNEKLVRDLRARESAETALRASEERYRKLEEHAPIGLALVALDGRFIRVNPALCALTGYAQEAMSTVGYWEITHPDDRAKNRILIERTLAGAIPAYEMEKRYVRQDGRVVWVNSSGSLVSDNNGNPSYLVIAILDISARKTVDQELDIARAAALAATEAKSRLLATMSHEIRTPMNGIIGMTELLSLSQLSDDQSEYVKVVRDSGESLLRILNDILDYSKIEAGKLDLDSVEFDLRSQLRSVVALVKQQFQSQGVALTTDVDSNVPDAIKGDPGRVRQILINLVGNALKFTPRGGSVRILVAAGLTNGATLPIRFTVTDTGCGIEPEMRQRLFEPFSQGDTSTTRKYGGTGLGLSICKRLVSLMAGEIGVSSTVDAGSSFWFTAPFATVGNGKRVLDAPAREMGERRAVVTPRTERILLAEDNEINVLLATKQFKRLGFDIVVVADGYEAVKSVQDGHYDIVFMDCQMPIMDGLEATREIRRLAAASERRIPIVAMTANALAEDRTASFAAGMDDFVSKPASIADLSNVLNRWLADSSKGATVAQ